MGEQPEWIAPGSRPDDPSRVPQYPAHPGRPAPRPDAPYPPPPQAGAAGYGEYRPGIVPLRPLRLGDIYGGVIKAIRGNAGATIGIAFLVTFAALLPTTALSAWLSRGTSFFPDLEDPEAFDAGELVTSSLVQNIPSLGVFLSSLVLAGFLAYVIGQAVLGRRVGIGETWRGTARHLLPVIGALVLVGIIEVVVVVLLIGPGVALVVSGVASGGSIVGGVLLTVLGGLATVLAWMYIWTRTAFVAPSIVLEEIGVVPGLRRSWLLTKGRGFWRIFGIRLLTAVIVGFIGQIIAMPLGFVMFFAVSTGGGVDLEGLTLLMIALSALVALLVGALTTPFTAGVDATLYVDERMRREALDVQLVRSARGEITPPWRSATP